MVTAALLTTAGLLAPVGCALAALLLTLLSWALVVRLPEPELEPGEPSPGYRDLASTAAVVLCCVLSGAAGALLGWWPGRLTAGLVIWASAALVLVWVDLRTTYLPSRLQWSITGGIALSLVIAHLVSPDAGSLVRAGIGALVSGGLFWVIWRFGPGMGFGDVRLALGLGLLTAAGSWAWWWASLLAGTVLGALVGGVLAVRGRRRGEPVEGFAYGPALWAGVWLGLALVAR